MALAERGDPHGDEVANKSQRAMKFSRWLLDTFGAETLNSGSGVMDIAGGRCVCITSMESFHSHFNVHFNMLQI